jgi:hypothetical protein
MLTIGSTIKETALEAVEVNESSGGIHPGSVCVELDAAAALRQAAGGIHKTGPGRRTVMCMSQESGPFGASSVLRGRNQ